MRSQGAEGLRLMPAAGVAGLLALVGVALVATSASADNTPPSLSVLAVGLPLALAPVAGILVATWPVIRRPVAPVGLSRGTRIIGPPAFLVMAPLLVMAALAFGGRALPTGAGVTAFVAVALALFLRGQILARRPLLPGEQAARDTGMLERTPGIAPVGALVTLAVLVVGAVAPGGEHAWSWTVLPIGFTLLVVYATVIVSLGRDGNLAAFALPGLLVLLIVWGVSPDVVREGRFPPLHLAAICLAGLAVAAVERARAMTAVPRTENG